jgi:glycosyltransferase involved in cell wall biosynthesis
MIHGHAALSTGRVVEVGPRPRASLGELCRGACAFLTASTTETQSLSVSEAVAVGCPAVVVDAAPVAGRPPGLVTVAAAEPHALGAAMRKVRASPSRDP